MCGVLVSLLTAASTAVSLQPAAAQPPPAIRVSLTFGGVAGSVDRFQRVAEGSSVNIKVSLSQQNNTGSALDFPIVLDTADSTASAADYTLAPSISIPNGAWSSTQTLTVVDDAEKEGSERVSLKLGALPRLSRGLLPAEGYQGAAFYIHPSDGADRGKLLFRVCPTGATCPLDGDTGWVETETPSITLNEGGDAVSYQYRPSQDVLDEFRWLEVTPVVQVGTGTPRDYDRLICVDSPDHKAIVEHQRGVHPAVVNGVSVRQKWPRPAGDEWGSCPVSPKPIGWDERDVWRTVTLKAGEDPDAFDHTWTAQHFKNVRFTPWRRDQGTYYSDPTGRRWPLTVKVVDNDEWTQGIEYSADGSSWTAMEEGGLDAAVPDALVAGQTYSFQVRLRERGGTARAVDYLMLRTDAWPSVRLSVGQNPRRSDERWYVYPDFSRDATRALTVNVRIAADAEPQYLEITERTHPEFLQRTDTYRGHTRTILKGHSAHVRVGAIGGYTGDSPGQDVTTPTVNLVAASSAVEGTDAEFKLIADPVPSSDLDVTVAVAATGDFGVAEGSRTVTIGTDGSGTLTVATTDDDTDEPDGSVTATLQPGDGYFVGPLSELSSNILDDDTQIGKLTDTAQADDPPVGYTVDPQVVAKVKVLASQTQHGAAHVNRWQRVLVAFGELDGTGVTGGAMTAAQAQQMADTHSSPVWHEVVTELTSLEAAALVVPEVSITATGDVTEGTAATFTVSASPAPAAPLTVAVTVTDSGGFAAAGQATSRQVTIGAGQAGATFTVTTVNDSDDEADGSITAALDTPAADAGYTVSATAGSAVVAVADDDDPPAGYTVDPQVVAKVKVLASQTQHGAAHVNRWQRVLVAFGELDGTGVTGGAMTAAQAQQMADTHSSPVWHEVVTELQALEAAT